MTPNDFANLAELVRRRSGLVLTPDKKTLAGNRLGPVARRFGFRNTAQLLAELPYPSEELARAVTEALRGCLARLKHVGIKQARQELPDLFNRAEAGEEIIISRQGNAVARIAAARDVR